MKTILAAFGAFGLIALAYGAGTMKYQCFSPAQGPVGDGSGRWFYMCLGPEPGASQRVSLAEAYRHFQPPPSGPTADDLLRPGTTARVSPPQPMR